MKSFSTNNFRGPKVPLSELAPVNCVLDLESGKQVFGDDMPLEEQMAGDSAAVRVYSHPLGGIFPPSLDELKLAVHFLDSHSGINYVHCKHGVDRTGMVVASYRILIDDWKPFDAAIECLREGMHICYLPWLIQLWRLKK